MYISASSMFFKDISALKWGAIIYVMTKDIKK
jgi:hypothetical protein